ncbi:MAG: glycerol-3-phosphate acyltransferase [Erysipelotrichaceae bacterium]|nr:glycerol-3-phosphate acyltransferase [Erysipelotrichaceae bacterium]
MEYIYTSLISYLLGSFNIAYFVSKAHGFDIRETGSRNAGASNMKVNFGWGAGIMTCLVDMAKAIIAMKLCAYLFPNNEIIPVLAGAMAVVGHIYPFYMGFHGGKGFASYIGMLLGLNWKFALVIMALTAIVTLISNYIVVGTLTTMAVVPLYLIFTKANIYVILIVTAVSALITYKHRINIRRIINHEEIVVFDRSKKKDK